MVVFLSFLLLIRILLHPWLKSNHVVITIFENSDSTHSTPKTSFALTVASVRYVKLPRVWQICFIIFPGVLPFMIYKQAFRNHLMQKALGWSFMLIAPNPPSMGALHKLFLSFFSNAFCSCAFSSVKKRILYCLFVLKLL